MVSATSASEIQAPVSGSRTAPGYFTGVQVSSAIESMARATAVFLAITTENSTFARKQGGHDGTSAVGGVATNEDCAGRTSLSGR